MESLEQYYTEDRIGERLTSMLPDIAPRTCVELSAGQGALVGQVLKKWPEIAVTTCELDPDNVNKIRSFYNGTHYNIDVSSSQFDSCFNNSNELFDLAISNPPYSWITLEPYHQRILELFNIEKLFIGNRIRSEVIFILQYLRITKKNGVLAFILPELIISSRLFKKFRMFLFTLCTPLSMAEIKNGEFKGTEARTYIITMTKEHSDSNSIEFTNALGEKSEMLLESLIHGFRNSSLPFHNDYSINSCQIKRGTLSGKECLSLNFPYYHTSGFHNVNLNKLISRITPVRHLGRKLVFAEANDVLISRVGTRVLGNAVIIKKGRFVISDCVFAVQLNDEINPHVFVNYWNVFFKENMENLSKGTCAKYITKDAIEICIHNLLNEQSFLAKGIKNNI